MKLANFGQKASFIAAFIFLFMFVANTSVMASSIVEFTAIGKIESIYKDRASMNVLYIIASEPENLNVATGSWISFDIPKGNIDKSSRRERAIGYGSVVEVSLIGNVATEYEVDENEQGDKKISSSSSASNVLFWTAQSCKRVKNPKEYLPEEKKDDSKKGRKKNKKNNEKEPVKIWTQEETVRGKVLVKNEKVYIKEDRLGKRDKGLEVISEEWANKLKELPNQKVVLHGVSHRTTMASGTMEIQNILKVYPK